MDKGNKNISLHKTYCVIALQEHKSTWYDEAILKISAYLCDRKAFPYICITLVTSKRDVILQVDRYEWYANEHSSLCVSVAPVVAVSAAHPRSVVAATAAAAGIPLPLSLSTASDERENASGGVLKTPLKL